MKLKCLICLVVIMLLACNKEDDLSFNPEKDTLCLTLTDINNKQYKSESFLIHDSTIHIMAPIQSDLTAQTAVITINKRQVLREDHDFSDFTNPVVLGVEFSHGELRNWKVNVYDLPVLIINTPDGEAILDKENRKEGCTMQLVNLDGSIEDLGTAGIKGRGNTSWIQDKKPYNIKLDKKHEILGMKKSKHWILLANCYYDRTQLHNATAFEMARLTDFPWVQSGEFVELILNGKHLGLYYLCEKIRVEKGKIEITEMTPENLSGEELTGGYLLESYVDYGTYTFDGYPFQTDFFNRTGYNWNNWLAWEIKSPDSGFIIPQEQFDYIKSAMNHMESLIYDDDKLQTGAYRDFFDIETAINWYLVEEASANEEVTRSKNIYLYKDRNDKFRIGPPWDFDAWSFGQSLLEWHNCNSWCLYYRQLLKDPVFRKRVKEKWAVYYTLWRELIPQFIDKKKLEISRSAQRNEQMWPNWTDVNLYGHENYNDYVENMSDDFIKQIDWLNEQIKFY